MPIDAPIADIVSALQQAGIDMRGSCSGHDEREGYIDLQDGRVLLMLNPHFGQSYMVNREKLNVYDYIQENKNNCEFQG